MISSSAAGSQPCDGVIVLCGGDSGGRDTRVGLLGGIDPFPVGGRGGVPIEIVILNLVTVSHYSLGPDQVWDAQILLAVPQ